MKNNKGFSLVELIVVIAIMAVLVGVLAPSLLRYVEKARYQKDVSAIDDVVRVCEMILSEDPIPVDVDEAGETITIKHNDTTVFSIVGGETSLEYYVADSLKEISLKSKTISSDVEVLTKYRPEFGDYSITVTGSGINDKDLENLCLNN